MAIHAALCDENVPDHCVMNNKTFLFSKFSRNKDSVPCNLVILEIQFIILILVKV